MRGIDGLGRVVIPAEIRNKLKIKPGDHLYIELHEGGILLTFPDEKTCRMCGQELKKKI